MHNVMASQKGETYIQDRCNTRLIDTEHATRQNIVSDTVSACCCLVVCAVSVDAHMSIYDCTYPSRSFQPRLAPAGRTGLSRATMSDSVTTALAAAAQANAEGVKLLTEALAASAPPVIHREEVGVAPTGQRVTVLDQEGRPPRMKVGSGNRGGAKVRARQEDQHSMHN